MWGASWEAPILSTEIGQFAVAKGTLPLESTVR